MYNKVHHITAGAGAGKTTELVNIIIRLVNGGADPQRMILTTYTDAAATEFREKSKAGLTPDNAVRMNGALVGTLHSIARRYIDRYWYLLGISPSVKPVSESVSKILMNRSLEDLVSGEKKALLNKYVETFGITNGQDGYDYDFWKETLMTLFDKMRGYGFDRDKIPEFQDATMRLLHDTFNPSQNKVLFDRYKPVFDKYLDYKDIVEAGGTDAGKRQYGVNCAQVKEIMKLDPVNSDVRKLKEVGNMNWGRPFAISQRGPVKDRYEPEINGCKDEIAEAAKVLSESWVPKEHTLIFDVAELLFDIMAEWMDAYERIKKETGVIDFADMEDLFLRLLGEQKVLDDISASVDYLFVDEFQDSTPIQAKIYGILSSKIKQSWFVGDRKQAIYGFAGSDSGLIAELVESFPKPETDPASLSGYKKDENGNSSQVLDTSRRSVPKLVNAANDIFIPAFAETNGAKKDVIPEEHVRLKVWNEKKDTPWDPLYHVEACKIVKGKPTLDYDALATFVCQMAESSEFKAAGYTLSDIAILTRVGGQAQRVGKALIKKNIRTGFINPNGFLDTPEVSLALAILRLSDGIDRDKSRAEIRRLLLDENLETLSSKVGNMQNNLNDYPGLEAFAKELRPHSILDRINEIIIRFDLNGVCGQWGNPDARRGNLNLLRKAAGEYADKSAILCIEADVHGFLSFLNDYVTNEKFDNSAEGVKVLTYHKSKGLDWKIVILCGLDDYKKEDTISGVSVLGSSTAPDGILAIPRLPDKQWALDSIASNSDSRRILELRRDVKRGEEKRLLYVGFTRAKEVVITAAGTTSPEVLHVLCPTVRTRNEAQVGDPVDIWGIPGVVSRYKAYTDDSDLKYMGITDPERYKDAGLRLPANPVETVPAKYHSPSQYRDPVIQAIASVEIAKDFHARTDIPHGHLDDNVFGDCIHHIFARCAPGKHEANLAVAESTLKGYGILDADAPGKAVACIEAFFDWLAANPVYGIVTGVEHEVPFRYTDREGRIFSGSMDLVWRTEKGCVLVDYKTFPGARSELFNRNSEHWAGKYASQLGVYADALSASDWKTPLDSILYYPVEGLVLRVKQG